MLTDIGCFITIKNGFTQFIFIGLSKRIIDQIWLIMKEAKYSSSFNCINIKIHTFHKILFTRNRFEYLEDVFSHLSILETI